MDPNELYKIIKDALSEGVRIDFFSLFVFALLAALASYLAAYLRTKGKNLATKEDIKGITDEIENVKTQYAKQIEMLSHENRVILSQLQQRHELKMAALDKRLIAHQEAYTLWWRLMGNIEGEREKVYHWVNEC